MGCDDDEGDLDERRIDGGRFGRRPTAIEREAAKVFVCDRCRGQASRLYPMGAISLVRGARFNICAACCRALGKKVT